MPAPSSRSIRWSSQRGRRTCTSQPTEVSAMARKCSTTPGGSSRQLPDRPRNHRRSARMRAMTTFRGVAVGTILVLALAGCGGRGGGGDGALSKAALVKRTNAICARYGKEGDRLAAPEDITDPAQARRFFDRAHDIAERQQRELEALRPAASAKARYAALTKATQDATTLLEDLAAAAKARDARKGASLLRRL